MSRFSRYIFAGNIDRQDVHPDRSSATIDGAIIEAKRIFDEHHRAVYVFDTIDRTSVPRGVYYACGGKPVWRWFKPCPKGATCPATCDRCFGYHYVEDI